MRDDAELARRELAAVKAKLAEVIQRDWYFMVKKTAPAPPGGYASLRNVLVSVPCVSRSCEQFPDEFDLHLLQVMEKQLREEVQVGRQPAMATLARSVMAGGREGGISAFEAAAVSGGALRPAYFPPSATSSHRMHQLNGLRQSTPPQNRQHIVLISNSNQYVEDFVGGVTFEYHPVDALSEMKLEHIARGNTRVRIGLSGRIVLQVP